MPDGTSTGSNISRGRMASWDPEREGLSFFSFFLLLDVYSCFALAL